MMAKTPRRCGAAAVTIDDIHKIFLLNYPGIFQTAGFNLTVLPFRSPDKAKPGRLEANPPDF
jgi:hypothetical protein